jgi:beta-glucosidase
LDSFAADRRVLLSVRAGRFGRQQVSVITAAARSIFSAGDIYMRHTRHLSACLLVLLAAAGVSVSAFGQGAAAPEPAYLDPSLPIEKRVDDLVSRMTAEEKASQLVHKAKAIPRLKVPAYNWWSEALHGVANTEGVTVFPEPIGLGATFNPPLIKEMGIAIGTEARAKHHDLVRRGVYMDLGLDYWAPNLNIFRDPRWGRGQETYGEDPFLTGRMGVAFVNGMQGDDPKYMRVVATPKHYAVHSGPEPLRHKFDAKASKHDMVDTYLPAFRAAVVEGKAGSIMCVYNRLNGDPGCASDFLLNEQLRQKWGFSGYGSLTVMLWPTLSEATTTRRPLPKRAPCR